MFITKINTKSADILITKNNNKYAYEKLNDYKSNFIYISFISLQYLFLVNFFT